MRILVIEDEIYVADLICTILEEMGASCLLARNAGEADGLLRRSEVDGVTLDLSMPGRGGLDWLESLAGSHPELACRTLVVTGMPLEPPARRRLDGCGAGFLAKPFTVDELQQAIAGCLVTDEQLESAHD